MPCGRRVCLRRRRQVLRPYAGHGCCSSLAEMRKKPLTRVLFVVYNGVIVRYSASERRWTCWSSVVRRPAHVFCFCQGGCNRMELRVDRSLPIGLGDQIKGQIVYAIACGGLATGTALPSVRELSEQLNVSPMVIARVYRELSEERLIATKPGIGTFVADIAQVDPKRGFQLVQTNLRQVADTYVRHALLLGYALDEVRREFLEQVDRRSSGGNVPHVALVGNFPVVTEQYAREIESILRDLNVRVTPIMLADLQTQLDKSLEKLNGVRFVITVPTRLQQVRALLEPYGYQVVSIAFRASPETCQRLSSLPVTKRLGVIATYPEFLQPLLDGVGSYCLSRTLPLSATLDQDQRVQSMLGEVDVAVYASGSEKVLDLLPDGVEAIEYLHVPEAGSVNRLRPLLVG